MNAHRRPDHPRLVPREPSFAEMLNDPIVQDLMRSDKVSRRSIKLLLKPVATPYAHRDSVGATNAP